MIVARGEKRKEKSEKWKGIKNIPLPICLEIGRGWEKEKRRILGLQREGKWKEKNYIFYFLCHDEVEREREREGWRFMGKNIILSALFHWSVSPIQSILVDNKKWTRAENVSFAFAKIN